MKVRTLKVDGKGRLHLPAKLREGLGIHDSVKARIESGSLIIEPESNVYERLSSDVKFKFKSVGKSLPSLRRAAEDQLMKEAKDL
jgi:bifunctional DNA-binding transcriptional regulator/antitoxin component of YhaV-PrlF toxin-antitoxin module